MFGKRSILFAAVPLLALLCSTPASAQDLAAAEALFNKGTADMDAGRFDTACPAIAESQRIDPRPGTLFTLADCQAKAGKVATAAALYEDYLRAVSQMTVVIKLRHAERAKVAKAHKAALVAQIPELTLSLPASAPGQVRVTRDGTEFTAASLGIAIPLDPGEHVMTTQIGDGPVVEQRITLGMGEKKTVELEIKAPGRARSPVPATVSAPVTGVLVPGDTAAAKAPAVAPEARGPAMNGRRVATLVAGGVGVAGLALGGVMGGLALSKKSVIEAGCVGSVCTAEGKAAADDARTPGLLSTIGFGVGGVGIAAGLVLLLTAPSAPQTGSAKKKITVSVLGASPDGAAVGVKGVF